MQPTIDQRRGNCFRGKIQLSDAFYFKPSVKLKVGWNLRSLWKKGVKVQSWYNWHQTS
jgi:hypothetical protein